MLLQHNADEIEIDLLAAEPVEIDEGVYVPLLKSSVFSVDGRKTLESTMWTTIEIEARNGSKLGPVGQIDRNELVENAWVWSGELAAGSKGTCPEPTTSIVAVRSAN